MYDDINFYTISKASEIIGVQTHVLRFWEKKFFVLKPKKSPSGRRYYSSSDIEYLHMIKKLLYDQGFTIKGAANLINQKYNKQSSNSHDSINKNILLIKTLIKEGSSLIKKNLD